MILQLLLADHPLPDSGVVKAAVLDGPHIFPGKRRLGPVQHLVEHLRLILDLIDSGGHPDVVGHLLHLAPVQPFHAVDHVLYALPQLFLVPVGQQGGEPVRV